jgi:predicted metalloprotease
MRWTRGSSNRNVIDRRGQGGMGLGGGVGIGGGIIGLILALIFGGDILGGGGDPGVATQTSSGDVAPVNETAAEAERREFVTFVLNDVQEVWAQTLPKYGDQYRDAKLVLFREATQSACGVGQAGMGPFYCPLDERAYLDLSFFDELHSRFGANGDFAQAYVIAHEIGHHVQHILGIDNRVRQMQQARPGDRNEYSVRLELQADCFSGVWANSTSQRRLLEQGDVEEALGAAAAIGDDRIQRQTTGSINPESFTHGSSQQRVTWFRRGMESGNPESCDTFAGGR